MSRAQRVGVLCGCAAIAIVAWLLARGSFAPPTKGGESAHATRGSLPPQAAAPSPPGLKPVDRRGLEGEASEAAVGPNTLRVRGKVTTPHGEVPPEGYVVARIEGDSGPSADPVAWSTDGSFAFTWTPEIDVLPPIIEIRAAALGWSLAVEISSVNKDGVAAVQIELGGHGEIAGKIVDDAGRPLAGLLLGAGTFSTDRSLATWPDLLISSRGAMSKNENDGPGWARTDAYGRFRIRGMKSASELEALGTDPVWVLSSAPQGQEGEAATTWVAVPGFRMQAHAQVQGSGPPPEFVVQLRAHDAKDDWLASSSGGVGERGWISYAFARDVLPTGPFHVEARLLSNECEPWSADVPATAKDGLVTFEVPVRRLDPSSLGRISVTLAPSLSGAVSMEVSRRVNTGSELGELWWALRNSGPDGRSFWEIPTGVQEVRVSLDTPIGLHPVWTGKVRVVQDETIVLQPTFAGVGSLRIRGPRAGEPGSRWSVTISDERSISTFTLSGVDHVLPVVAAGTYRLDAMGGSGVQEVTIQEGRETLVEVGSPR